MLSTCSAGSYSGTGANFTPPAAGCPAPRALGDRQQPAGPCAIPPAELDPLLSRLALDDPRYGKNVVSMRATLKAGIYCEDLRVTRSAQVTLDPSVYVMKDGLLVVDVAEPDCVRKGAISLHPARYDVVTGTRVEREFRWPRLAARVAVESETAPETMLKSRPLSASERSASAASS